MFRLRPVSLAVLILPFSGSLVAQDQTIPLKNWAAPLYWQPPASESENTAKAAEPEPRLAGAMTPLLVFVGVTPCRLVDTRVASGQIGAFGPPTPTVGSTRTFPIPTHPSCAIPAEARAYSLNVTVVPLGPLGYLTTWPTGQPQPLVSTLTSLEGKITSNAAIVPAGTNGSINVFVTNITEVVIDINGYYLPPGALALSGGSAAAPALTFSNDTNSGVYSPSSGTVSIAAAGTNRLNVNSSGASVNGNVSVSGYVDVSGTFKFRGSTVLAASGGSFGSNIAVGSEALAAVTDGNYNTAVGSLALNVLTTGNYNTAVGRRALQNHIDGLDNTAIGWEALGNNTSGGRNIAIGSGAALSVAGTNNDNIHIGNAGSAADSATIRIGSSSQTRAHISGIRGITTVNANAIPVVIDSAGQLGTASSSRRIKTDIRDIGDTTDTIMALRPVRFHYKAHEPGSPDQYGLVAEEVAEVAPELASRDNDGQVDAVFYDKVNAMLLNEVQKQHRLIQTQSERLESQQRQLADLLEKLADLERQVRSGPVGQK